MRPNDKANTERNNSRRVRLRRRIDARQWPFPRLLRMGLFVLFVVHSLPLSHDAVQGMCSSGSDYQMGIPVACAATARQVSQPTKELDEEERRRSGSTVQSSLAEKTKLRKGAVNEENKPMTLNQLLAKAGKKGLGGGIPGLFAGVIQVLSLMWIRTIINYQCRYGASFREAFVTLRNDGGIPRFYRGLWFALVQAPLTRFVSTAANDGVEALMAGFAYTKNWGPARTTIVASIVVGLCRIALMPIDTCKTVLQIDSMEGFRNLMRRVRAGKVNVLYSGSVAVAISAAVGHWPWFYTYNILSRSKFVQSMIQSSLLRNAVIGVAASLVSDTVVNSIRVVKTTKQSIASKHEISYLAVVRLVLASDGWTGLFGRGLGTRIFANALQSLVFTVIWRGLADYWKKRSEDRHSETLSAN